MDSFRILDRVYRLDPSKKLYVVDDGGQQVVLEQNEVHMHRIFAQKVFLPDSKVVFKFSCVGVVVG